VQDPSLAFPLPYPPSSGQHAIPPKPCICASRPREGLRRCRELWFPRGPCRLGLRPASTRVSCTTHECHDDCADLPSSPLGHASGYLGQRAGCAPCRQGHMEGSFGAYQIGRRGFFCSDPFSVSASILLPSASSANGGPLLGSADYSLRHRVRWPCCRPAAVQQPHKRSSETEKFGLHRECRHSPENQFRSARHFQPKAVWKVTSTDNDFHSPVLRLPDTWAGRHQQVCIPKTLDGDGALRHPILDQFRLHSPSATH
jgi:hypothetical protein